MRRNLHATYTGYFIKLVEQLTDDSFWIDNKIFSPSDIKRMRDAEFVSELLVGIMEGVQQGTTTLDKYYGFYDTEFKEKERWQKHFQKILEIIQEIFGDLRRRHWKSKGDFYVLFIAVSQLLRNHYFLLQQHDEIKEKLIEFRRRVNTERESSRDKIISEYHETIGHAPSNKKNRNRRTNIIKNLLLAYVISRDPTRDFSEE
jgi:hypothetical protein